MSGLVSALLNATNFRTPFLRTLIPSIGLAYGLQAAVAIPSILGQTERFYDASGSVTYIACTALSLYLPTLRARLAPGTASGQTAAWPSLLASLTSKGGVGLWNWRQVVLSAAVSIWAARLGSFLFSRVTSEGGRDSRFDSIRGSPAKFGVAFFLQATWVSLCLMPVLAVNSIPSAALGALPFFTITDILGLLMYVGGITFEATADKQKSQWMQEKKEKRHNEDFLTRGLWSKSRHPNYFGESTLWTGIATTAAGVMLSSAGQAGMGFSGSGAARLGALAMAGISPAFVTFLLLKVSGIPMSENKYDERYGNRKDYQEWKKNTKHSMAWQPGIVARDTIARGLDSAALRERTFPRVYEYLKSVEINYATYGPFDREDANVQIPFSTLPLVEHCSLLLPVWQVASNQIDIYEMTLNMGMTPKWPTLHERLTRSQAAYAAPFTIPCPCFSLAVFGGDRACYSQLARQIYNFLLSKILERNVTPVGSQDSWFFKLRTQNFIVMVYDPAKITDYNLWTLGPFPTLRRASHPDQNSDAVLNALHQKIQTICEIFLPSMNPIERACLPHWCRMMPPLSGGYDPDERDEHGRVVDGRITTSALLVPSNFHADWAGMQRSMDRMIQAEGLVGKVQVRIVEELDLPVF
ncbi:DUF1295-domain-containing protein [Hortaea werneckii]|nr:DUF1295-domain-containing protein [Hortaea werneckii]